MLARLLRLLAVSGLALVTLLAAAFGFVQTGFAKSALESMLERQLAGAAGGAEVAGLSGLLPFAVRLERLRLADAEGTWLEVDEARLDLAPGALLAGRVEIREAGAARIALHRLPPAADEPARTTTLPELAGLPESLPPVRIERLAVPRIELGAPLLGRAAVLALEGRAGVADDGRSLEARLRVERIDERSAEASLAAGLDLRARSLDLELEAGERGGLVAAATGLARAGAARLALSGKGPLAHWQGTLAAGVAGLGALDGRIGLDLEGLPGVELALAGRLEPDGLPASLLAALGERPELALTLRPDGPERLQLTTLHLATPALALDGKGMLDLAADRLEGRLDARAPDLGRLAPLAGVPLAGRLGLGLEARGSSRAPELRLSLDGEALVLAGLGAESLDLALDAAPAGTAAPEGTLAVRLAGSAAGLSLDGAPLGGDGLARIEGTGELRPDGPARIAGLDLAAAGLELRAEGTIDPRSLEGTLRLDARAPELAALAPLLGGATLPEGALRLGADLGLQGPGKLAADLELVGERFAALPPGAAELLGAAPVARARLALRDGRRLELGALTVEGAAARLAGDAALELADQRLAGALSLAVPDLAPLSGLAGDALVGRAELGLDLSGTLAAPRLRLRGRATEPGFGPYRLESLALSGGVELAAVTALELEATARIAGEELRLEAAGRLAGEQLELARARLVGPDLALDGSGSAALDRLLVRGRIKGAAHDLARLAPLGLGPFSGALELEAEATTEGGRQQVRARLRGERLGGAFGSLAQARVDLALADALGRGGVQGEAVVEGLEAGELALERASLGLDGTLADLGLRFATQGQQAGQPLALEAQGRLAALSEPRRLELARLGGSLAGQAIRLKQPARITLEKGVLDLGTLDVEFGPATARIRAGLGRGTVRAEANLERLELARLAPLGLPELPGMLGANLRLGGPARAPDGRLELNLSGLGRPDAPAGLEASLRLTGGRELALEARTSGLGPEPLTLTLQAPLRVDLEAGRVEPIAEAPASGRARGRLELARLAPLLPIDGQSLEGPLEVDLALAGRIDAPWLSGSVRLEGGALADATTGLRLRAVRASARAEGPRILLERLEAHDRGSGRLTGSGALDLAAGSFELELELRGLQALATDLGTATLSGTAGARGGAAGLELRARLEVDRGELRLPDPPPPVPATIPVEEVGRGARTGIAPGAGPLPAVALDVRVAAAQRLFVRGRGLDSEWAGELSARGTLAEPDLVGRIELRRGFLDFLGSRFSLRDGVIEFDGARPPLPRLEVQGEARKADITARIGLRGRLPKFELALESEPPLPREEVLSRVLFGREMARITPLQGALLANSIATLQGGGIDALRPVRGALGLDTLDVGGDVDTGAALRAGKYVSERVFVEMQRGVTPESGRARVEVDLGNNVRGTSEVRETSQTGFGLEWRYDY